MSGNRTNRRDRRDLQMIHNIVAKMGAVCGGGVPKGREKEVKLHLDTGGGERVEIDRIVEDENGYVYARISNATFDDIRSSSNHDCPNEDCEEKLLILGEGSFRCSSCGVAVSVSTDSEISLIPKGKEPLMMPMLEVAS